MIRGGIASPCRDFQSQVISNLLQWPQSTPPRISVQQSLQAAGCRVQQGPMEALTAIGLAANILQFIDLGIKVVSKGNQIYRSGDGTLPEHHDLAVVTNDLLLLQTKLSGCLRPSGSSSCLSEDDQALEKLAGASNDLAVQLLGRLNRVKAQGRHLRWKSWRQALKSICTKKDVDEMARRMALLRDELNTRILVSLRCVYVDLRVQPS